MAVKIEGIDALKQTLAGFETDLRKQVEVATLDAAKTTQKDAKDLSAVKTGFFKSRWQIRVPVSTPHRIEVETFNDASYAIPLIYGHRTRSGSHVAPRNCIDPAFLHARIQMDNRLKRLQLKKGR